MPGTHASLEDRLWRSVDIGNAEDCWEWQRSCFSSGYGQIRVGKTVETTHRVAWKLSKGEIPSGLFVCHTCDNRPCCNPSHLFLGSPLDNMRDKVDKGRQARLNGETNPASKLTNQEVIEIRNCANGGDKEIAEEYGVSRRLVRLIRQHKIWTHLL